MTETGYEKQDALGRAWLNLSLVDAKNNCRDHGATATLYLRGGQTIRGKIDAEHAEHMDESVHVKTRDGGWATILTGEVIAVKVEP